MDNYQILFKNAQCAPNINFNGNSCYPLEVIENMIKIYYNTDDNKNDKVNILYNNKLINISLYDLKTQYKDYINNLKNNKEDYKTFLVDLLSQLMILNKNKIFNNKKNKYHNMNKQYNWLLLPAF